MLAWDGKLKALVWPYGVLVVLLVGVMWPAWSTRDQIVVGSDVLAINYPFLVLWRDALAAGEFPFWNPYTLSGSPAFADLHAGFAYPFTIALTWLPPIVAANWTLGLHVLLAGLGAAWCARRLGSTANGQLLAGAAYALGSATTARLWAGQLGFLEAGAWLPWAAGVAVSMRNTRSIALLALVVGLMALAGLPELLIFSIWWLPLWAALAAAAIVACPAGAWRRAHVALQAAVRTALGVGLGFGLAAFQLVPAVVVLSVSNRASGMSWDFQTMTSLPPWHLLTLLAPLVFGDPRQNYWPGADFEWHERLLYVGVVPLMAAVVLPTRWRWLCWGTALLAVALAFGRYMPWYAWTQVLPGYSSFRIPSKHLALAALSLAIAAGLGVERLRGRRVALAGLACAAALLLASLASRAYGGNGELATQPLQVASLASFLAGLACLLPPRWSSTALLAIAVVELTIVLQPFRLAPQDPRNILYQAYGIRDFQRAAIIGAWDVNVGNYGPVLHITQPTGYTALFSSGYATLMTGSPDPDVFIRVGSVDNPALAVLGYQAVFDNDARQLTVLQPSPPRVWVARCAWPSGADTVRDSTFPRQGCVTRSASHERDTPAAPGPARVTAEGNSWLQVSAEGPGWLMSGEPFYPGWTAEVDGEGTTVEVLDGAVVGVPVAAGSHIVTLRYVPGGLTLGLILTAAASLALVGLWSWTDLWRLMYRRASS